MVFYCHISYIFPYSCIFPVALSKFDLCQFSALIYSKPSPADVKIDKADYTVTTQSTDQQAQRQTGTDARSYSLLLGGVLQKTKTKYMAKISFENDTKCNNCTLS